MKTTQKPVLSGQLTPEEFEKLKKENGTVFTMTVPEDDKGIKKAVCYLKRPSRTLVGAYLIEKKSNPVSAAETMLRTCWLAGDERIINDDEMFYSAFLSIEDLITVRNSEIKKN